MRRSRFDFGLRRKCTTADMAAVVMAGADMAAACATPAADARGHYHRYGYGGGYYGGGYYGGGYYDAPVYAAPCVPVLGFVSGDFCNY